MKFSVSKEAEEIVYYRDSFVKLGINPNKFMSCIEAIITRVAKKKGDNFIPFGVNEEEYLEDGELIYSVGNEVRTRRWIWRQSEQGKITKESKNIFFPIDGFKDKNYNNVISARD